MRSSWRESSGRDVEGVLLAARGMIRRKVQRVEVELLGFDFRSFRQFPSHRDEGVGDMLGQDRDRMPGAGRLPRRRQGDVDALGDQHGRVPLGTQRRQPFVVALLGLAARGVDALAGVGPLLLGHGAQGLSRQRQRRAVTKVFGLDARQRVEIVGAGDGLAGSVDRFGQGLRRQVDGLITHAATLSLLTRLFGLPVLPASGAEKQARVECRS